MLVLMLGHLRCVCKGAAALQATGQALRGTCVCGGGRGGHAAAQSQWHDDSDQAQDADDDDDVTGEPAKAPALLVRWVSSLLQLAEFSLGRGCGRPANVHALCQQAPILQ